MEHSYGSEDVVAGGQVPSVIAGQEVAPAGGTEGTVEAVSAVLRRKFGLSEGECLALDAAGFTSVASLRTDPVTLRNFCPELMPGHAVAVTAWAAEAEQGAQGKAVDVSLDYERVRLAGHPPTMHDMPNLSVDSVSAYLLSVVSWCMLAAAGYGEAMRDAYRGLEMQQVRDAALKYKQIDEYIGIQMLQAISNKTIKALFRKDIYEKPSGITIMHIIQKAYVKKDEAFITNLREQFISITPCSNIEKLRYDLNKWMDMRNDLKNMGDKQSDQACKGSLLRLVSKLDEVKSVLKMMKVIQGMEVVLEEMILIVEGIADDNVVIPKVKSNTSNKTTPIIPLPKDIKQPTTHSVNTSTNNRQTAGFTEVKRHCHRWNRSNMKCIYTQGAESGEGPGKCRYRHDPHMHNTDDPEIVRFMANTPCREGSACMEHKEGKCNYKHE